MGESDQRIKTIKAHLDSYPDFPKQGINFQDIFGIYGNVEAHAALDSLVKEYARSVGDQVDLVVGLDSRGFLMGPTMALEMNKPFRPIRKKGKLPGECISVKYDLEYGSAEVEIQAAAVKEGDRVLVVDDLLATGGTLEAAVKLVEECKGIVKQCWVLVELTPLKGVEKVKAPVYSVLKVDEE